MPIVFLAALAGGVGIGAYLFGEGTTTTAVKIGGGIAIGWFAAKKLG